MILICVHFSHALFKMAPNLNQSSNKTISNDVRTIIIRMIVDEGRSQRDVSILLHIPRTTVQGIYKRYRNTGSISPGRPTAIHRRILTDELKIRIRELVDDNITVTIQEIKEQLQVDVHLTTVWRWVKSLGFTYKITRPIYERRNDDDVKEQRFQYANWYLTLNNLVRYRNLIFIDESPFNIHMFRSHSWAQRGTTPNPIIHPRRQNVTMILAISGANLIHCEAITTGVNGNIFTQFMTELIRIIGTEESFIFVMDNVRFHHSSDLPTANNISYKYLPPYSPFLNPCEEVFSCLKNKVRRNTPPRGNIELIQRMREASITIQDVMLSNYFCHCESFFGKCQRREDIGRD